MFPFSRLRIFSSVVPGVFSGTPNALMPFSPVVPNYHSVFGDLQSTESGSQSYSRSLTL